MAAFVSAFLFAAPARGDDAATLLRVFLRDGTSLVSYGEPARVGDRVVFSMPTEVTPNPALHLVNLPADRVDWDRTDRYANAARAAQYLKSQAELDYAALSNQLAQALNDVASTTDQAQRLAITERARSMLVEWPQRHYNYRQSEVRQMVTMLDEAIADLRAASGASRFDISLSAFAEAPVSTERLLPPLTLRESIEQLLNAAHAVDSSIERTSLLSTALSAIDRDKDNLPPDWVAANRPAVQSAINAEVRMDRSYRALTTSVLALADQRAKLADVRGVERLLVRVERRDAELGRVRPEAVSALVAEVEAKLDLTRRLRLARDRWELRLPAFTAYGAAIRAPIALFAQLKPQLEDIKALAGSSPGSLASLQQRSSQLLQLMSSIVAPQELAAAHALMVSAAQLASSAVNVRREAVLANDMDGAWNASSAAAGALMLGARARVDILSLLRPPQLP
jgi:hypothetical protein